MRRLKQWTPPTFPSHDINEAPHAGPYSPHARTWKLQKVVLLGCEDATIMVEKLACCRQRLLFPSRPKA